MDTDNPAGVDKPLPILCSTSDRRRSGEVFANRFPGQQGRSERGGGPSGFQDAESPYVRHQQLARWYQTVVAPYRVRVDNLTTSFRSGLALLAVLRRYCPDLMAAYGADEKFYSDLKASLTSVSNWQEIRAKAFSAIQDEFGLNPPLSLNDKESMYRYLSQLKDILSEMTPAPLPAAMSTSMNRESPLRSTSSKQDAEQSFDMRNGRRERTPTAVPSVYGHETEEQRQERYNKRLQVRFFILLLLLVLKQLY